MKKIQIYSTSRLIRIELLKFKNINSLIPTLIKINDFEKNSILLGDYSLVDSLQRNIFLKNASNFKNFKNLKINRELIKFFTQSGSIFKFFEELALENVSFDKLLEADSYAEFEEHIDILKQLLKNYKEILDSKKLTDRMFIPKSYKLNLNFIEYFDKFELNLNGYLSYFELELINKIAKIRPFIINMVTSEFNQKVQERFQEFEIDLPKNTILSFDMSRKIIINQKENKSIINSKVFSAKERLLQIPIMFKSIQNMVNNGMKPENIVVLIPDETFKNQIKLFDNLKNLNFSMGFDYSTHKNYKKLEVLHKYWQYRSEESINLLKQYRLKKEVILEIKTDAKIEIKEFWISLEKLNFDLEDRLIKDKKSYFSSIFIYEKLNIKVWLFLWLQNIKNIRIDDINGGKITVMGVLESRGVKFSGVVILDFNSDKIPAIVDKDMFLNSALRSFAGLPTKNDRESLQKDYYKRVLEQADKSVIIYHTSGNSSTSKFLYELGLSRGVEENIDISIFYKTNLVKPNIKNPIIENFNAKNIVWSSTKLTTFLSCKRKYYYSYIENLKERGTKELKEGVFIHKLLYNLFLNKESFTDKYDMNNSLNRLIDELLETNSSKIKFSKILWKNKLQNFLKNQIIHFKDGWNVSEKELSVSGEISGLQFKGIIDRIDIKDDKAIIIDYKTGSVDKINRNMLDFQMNIYENILQYKYINIEVGFLEVFNNGNFTFLNKKEEKNFLLLKNIEDIKNMEKVVCEKTDNISMCQHCSFTILCSRGEYLK